VWLFFGGLFLELTHKAGKMLKNNNLLTSLPHFSCKDQGDKNSINSLGPIFKGFPVKRSEKAAEILQN